MAERIKIEKLHAGYRLLAYPHRSVVVQAQDLLDIMDFALEHAEELRQETRAAEVLDDMSEDWKLIEAQAAADLETVQTDQDAYTFIEKYLSRDLRGRYLAIYRSDRHEMNRSPRQSLDNLLALPPLE